jgi:hypothetical protein
MWGGRRRETDAKEACVALGFCTNKALVAICRGTTKRDFFAAMKEKKAKKKKECRVFFHGLPPSE